MAPPIPSLASAKVKTLELRFTPNTETLDAKVMVKRKMMLKVDGETQILRPRHQIEMGLLDI